MLVRHQKSRNQPPTNLWHVRNQALFRNEPSWPQMVQVVPWEPTSAWSWRVVHPIVTRKEKQISLSSLLHLPNTRMIVVAAHGYIYILPFPCSLRPPPQILSFLLSLCLNRLTFLVVIVSKACFRDSLQSDTASWARSSNTTVYCRWWVILLQLHQLVVTHLHALIQLWKYPESLLQCWEPASWRICSLSQWWSWAVIIVGWRRVGGLGVCCIFFDGKCSWCFFGCLSGGWYRFGTLKYNRWLWNIRSVYKKVSEIDMCKWQKTSRTCCFMEFKVFSLGLIILDLIVDIGLCPENQLGLCVLKHVCDKMSKF